ncbi:sulfatase-like hydrolase/transferase [Nocardioides ungokensis]
MPDRTVPTNIARRRLLLGAGAALGATVGVGMTRGRASAAPGLGASGALRHSDRPNVLWIITDDQPRHTLPKMRKFWTRVVKGGVRFTKGNVAVPLCGPSRASILTSMYAHNHGCETNEDTMAEFNGQGLDQDTIGTRMSAAGYACGYFGKYMNGYDDKTYVAPGWQRWVASLGTVSHEVNVAGTVRTVDMHVDEFATRQLNTWLRKRATDPDPWFAVFAPTNPHSDTSAVDSYNPSPAHEHDFDGVAWNPPALNEVDMSDKPSWLHGIPFKNKAKLRAGYEGKLEELQDVDDQVDSILTNLSELGMLANTWVFFVTDNGYMLGEHRLAKKEVPYEECVGTPFVVTGPGVTRGTVSGKLVTTVDLMPTTLEIAGLDPDAGRDLDGRSFLTPITTSDWSGWRKRMLTEHPAHDWAHLREHDTVLIDYYAAGEQEVYDLAADPHQMSSQHATTDTTAMTARLTALRNARGKSLRALER